MSRSLLAGALCACCLFGCEDTFELEACDIRKASCQQDVFLAVQHVRGMAWDPWLDMPPIRVISSDQYRAELEAKRRASSPAPADYDYYTPALKMLALFDPDEAPDGSTEFAVSFYVAYYESSSNSVTIIDRGQSTDQRGDTRKLAHELTHAAQYRDVTSAELNGWVRTTDDLNARGAVVEGEARLYENLVDLLMRHVSGDNIDWDRYHADWIAHVRDMAMEDASPMRFVSSELRYALGSRYATAAWREAGSLGVRRAIANHPTTTQAFMFPPGSKRAAKLPWPCKPPSAPTNYKSRVSTSLGGWSTYAFATRMLPNAEPEAWALGQAWQNDRITVYADADKNLALVWQLQFSSEASAQTFASALSGLPATLHVSSASDADRVSLLAAQRPEDVDSDDWMTCTTSALAPRSSPYAL
jgi:hypothetical protein